MAAQYIPLSNGGIMQILTIDALPVWMVLFHKLASMGRATEYSSSKRCVRFDLTTPQGNEWTRKHVFLRDAVALTVFYRGVCP